MREKQHTQPDPLTVLNRLSWWSGVVDELATCPIEEMNRNGDTISFFLDTRRCATQPLPGFPTAAQRVREMTRAEQHDLTGYLVRLHKARFACAVRAGTGRARGGSPEVEVISDELEFHVPVGFIRQVLEVAHD